MEVVAKVASMAAVRPVVVVGVSMAKVRAEVAMGAWELVA